MKKKIIPIISLVIIAVAFAAAFIFSKKQTSQNIAENTPAQKTINVTTKSIENSRSLSQEITYPAITAGDQEVTVTAQSSGTVTQLNFDLGNKVSANMQLLKIDSLGGMKAGESNLKNSAVQALEFAVNSAKASYKLAKDNYEKDDSYANKKAKDIAKINLEAAEINLQGALDSHTAFSPISGVVTQRLVSLGDSVTAGQSIAKISKTGMAKIQFYINKEELENFKLGMPITISADNNKIIGVVSKISPQADTVTRRFLIEAKPSEKATLVIGNVINVSVNIAKTPTSAENIILPLSVISVGQNENYIFIAENGKAKKQTVEIVEVIGENAEVKTNLPQDAQIIIDGSKLVKDGSEVNISNQ